MNLRKETVRFESRSNLRRPVGRLLLESVAAIVAASGFVFAASTAGETVWLDSLDLRTMHQNVGTPHVNRSGRDLPLSIGGRKFERGVGTHAVSTFRLTLNGGTDRFTASVGVDDAAGGPAAVIFRIIADKAKVFDSGVVKSGEAAKLVDVDLRGVKVLALLVEHGGNSLDIDYADWADARFIISGCNPVPYVVPYEAPYLLTPKSGPAPRINGPTVYGARAGHPFLYRIPAQGERPMTFSASGLPTTLQLDAHNGIITGTTPPRGEYEITFRTKNSQGRDSRSFKLVSGNTLSLTPPMGWNHWYAHYQHHRRHDARSGGHHDFQRHGRRGLSIRQH